MSTLRDCITDIEKIAGQKLVGFKKLPFAFDIEKNSFAGNFKRYAVIPSEAQRVDFSANLLNISHGLQIIITDNFINQGSSDENLRNTLLDMYDLTDDLITSVISHHVDYVQSVYSVEYDGTDLPEIYDNDKVCVLRLNFKINYKKTI